MTSLTGNTPNSPIKYLGANVAIESIVSRNREPTGADYRQPETGKLYPLGSLWLVSKNPTTGEQGDLWYLAKIVANVADWSKIGGSSSNLLFVGVDASSGSGTNPVLPTDDGLITVTGGQVSAGVVGTNVIRTDSTAENQYTIEIQRSSSSASTSLARNGVSHFSSDDFIVNSSGFVRLNGSNVGQVITTEDDLLLISPTNGNWNIFGAPTSKVLNTMTTFGDVPSSTVYIENKTFTTKFVVDTNPALGERGTFSDIQTAINAASSGDTIYLRSGTYTEDITLKAGVNITAMGSSGFTPTVTIKGKCTFSGSGFVTISGVKLETNGDYAVSVTGSSASRLYLINCFINESNFTAIQQTSSNSSASIRILYSWINTANAGFGVFNISGAGNFTLFGVNSLEGTVTNVASTFSSSGILIIRHSTLRFPITTSGTGRISADKCEFNTFVGNRQCLDIGSTGVVNSNYLRSCTLLSGTSPALNISSSLYIANSGLYSSNALPITGAGTLLDAGVGFLNGPPLGSDTTLTISRQPFDAGRLYGNFSGATVGEGYLGEYISSKVAFNAGVTLTNNVAADVTSINLTPGNWDVTGIVMFTGITTGTYQDGSVGTTSATINNSTYGDSTTSSTFTSTTNEDVGVTIPNFRIRIPAVPGSTVSTPVYLIARAGFTVGTAKAYGRISATRVC